MAPTEQQPFPLEADMQEQTQQQQPQDIPQEPHVPIASSLLDEAIKQTMMQDEEMRTELAKLRFRSEQMTFDNRLASMFAASGQFDDLKKLTPKQAIATALMKIEIGRSYGLSAGLAMQCVYIVKGVPSIKAEVLAARMRQAGYDWRMKIHTDKVCTLYPLKDGKHIMCQALDEKGVPVFDKDGMPKLVPAEVTYTIEDAKRAKLIKADGAWETVPRNMLFWRCISNMKRFHATEVGLAIPTLEELRDEDAPQRPNLPIGKQADGTLVAERVA